MTTPSLSRNPLRDYPPAEPAAVATEEAREASVPSEADDLVASYEASVRRVATIIAASLVVAAIATGAAITLARFATQRRANRTTP